MSRTALRSLLDAAFALAVLADLPAAQGGAELGPRLVLTRLEAPVDQPWRPGTRLAFEVVLSHPCMNGAALEADFVLDPEGGFGKAIELVVTDASGAAVALAFTRHGGSETGALVLRRLERRRLWFELDPGQQALRVPSGRIQIAARLHTTTGSFRGTARSAPVSLTVAAAPVPELVLLGGAVASVPAAGGPTVGASPGSSTGTLYRGWPAFVAVQVRVPEGGDPVLLPVRREDWPAMVQLSLQSEAGVPVPDACRQLPVDFVANGRLDANATCLVRFQVPATTTAALAEGRYRWTATLRSSPAPADGSASTETWSGTVDAMAACECVAPPDPLPPRLVWERERALVHDDLAAALLLRAEAERPVGYLGDRRRVAARMATPILAAERRALTFLKEHPDDAAACLLLVEVCAAADDPAGAHLFAGRAVAVGLANRRAAAAAAGTDAAPEVPSLHLAYFAERVANGGRPLDRDIAAAFHEALAALRAGTGNATSDSPTPVAATTPATNPPAQRAPTQPGPGKPAQPPEVLIGTVTHGDADALDAGFAAEARGQWAARAVASSQYGTDNYSAARTTGAPDVPQHGDHTNAWAPGTADGGAETLELSFARATLATAVRVRQSFHPGTVVRVTLAGVGGERLVVFDGPDPGHYAPGTIGWFVVQFPPTKFAVTSVELALDTKRVNGWNEIDAVQLVGDATPR